MSKELRDWVHKSAAAQSDRAPRKELSREERMAFVKLRREAAEAGVTLASGGRGGLAPSFVLRIMRRDEYTCKVHGDRGEGEFGGLTLHHKGGIPESEWLRKKGHKNDLNNLVMMCAKAHDDLHGQARKPDPK